MNVFIICNQGSLPIGFQRVHNFKDIRGFQTKVFSHIIYLRADFLTLVRMHN